MKLRRKLLCLTQGHVWRTTFTADGQPGDLVCRDCGKAVPTKVLLTITTVEGKVARIVPITQDQREAEIKVFEDAGFPNVVQRV